MHSYPTPISNPGDFRAFYCAGKAIDIRKNPYLTEPLRSCERDAASDFGMAFVPAQLIPAPLPPYAFALFAPLGLLPFALASNLWFVISCLALLAAIVATGRLSGRPILAIGGAMLVAGGLVSFGEGQIAPLATASFVFAALALRNGRFGLAGAALGCAMLEPHVALPAIVACLGEKRARPALLVTVATLAVLDLAFGGIPLSRQYATVVLPLQAAAQIDHIYAQFSLSSVLWGLGASRSTAGFAGTLDYAAMFALGVWTATRLRQRYDDRAMLVLVPPAFVILGGPYVHLFAMVVALPLAFVCLSRISRRRGLIIVALVGLALPLQFFVVASPLRHLFYPHPAPPLAAVRDVLPASAVDGVVQATEVRNADSVAPDPMLVARIIAIKLPTWIALLALIAACVAEAVDAGGDSRRNTGRSGVVRGRTLLQP